MFSTSYGAGLVGHVDRLALPAFSPIVLTAALLLAGVPTALAQQPSTEEQKSSPQPSKWEFLVASGILFPTGVQRGVVRRANLTSAQLSYVVRPDLAVTADLGWARSRDLTSSNNPKLDIFTYDLGVEWRPLQWSNGRAAQFRPFVGMGAGVRTYDYHSLDVAATHNIAGYIDAGGEFGLRRLRLRLEVRDYLTGFDSFNGRQANGVRNDVVAMIGLRIAGN